MRGFLTAIILVAAAYALAFAMWVAFLPQTPAVPPQADGIVALTGGGARLDAAMALFDKGVGQRLLISGVDLATTRPTLKNLMHGGARFDCCVDIGYAAEDTSGNAAETADWARNHRFHSVVIVTAGYHMPRALREFETAMPDITLLPYPVERANRAGWWRDPRALLLLHREFAKYLASEAMAQVSRFA